MKTLKKTIAILSLLFAVFTIEIGEAQVVLIPNGGFDTDTSGWNITGTNLSITTNGGEMVINVSGIYTRDFVITSPSFHLDASKTYKLHTDYRNVQNEQPMGGFDNVYLKDSNGETVADVTLYSFDTGNLNNMYSGYSNNFDVATSGTYHLEYIGAHNPEEDFRVDNVGFEEIIQNTFSGTVTLDENNDGCTTSNTTVKNFPIQLKETNSNTNFNVYTDANGEFLIETQNITGDFITQINDGLYDASPANYTNTISSGVHDMTNHNFCITPNATANDLMISLIPVTQAMPGFSTYYQLKYTNLGTTTLSGTVDLNFDDAKVSFSNSSIAADVTTSSSLAWNYANLTPLETRSIDLKFSVFTPPTVNDGDILVYTASVTPISGDYSPSNNTFVFDQTALASLDPNDITILEGPLISESQAADYLGVLIRFQNTGTASAVSVRVENTLDAFFDWSTFEPIAASHNYSTIVSNDNEVEFVFNNINLPDSTANESASHGWVYYKIKPKSSFDIGDVISAEAAIYFDYNLPVMTNTATTEIDETLSIKAEVGEENSLLIYPNPVNDKFTILIQESAATYSLMNISGRVVSQGRLKKGENSLNISNLSSGLYLLKMTTDEKMITKKILKE